MAAVRHPEFSKFVILAMWPVFSFATRFVQQRLNAYSDHDDGYDRILQTKVYRLPALSKSNVWLELYPVQYGICAQKRTISYFIMYIVCSWPEVVFELLYSLCWNRWGSRLRCCGRSNDTGRNYCLSRRRRHLLSTSVRSRSWTHTCARYRIPQIAHSRLVNINNNNNNNNNKHFKRPSTNVTKARAATRIPWPIHICQSEQKRFQHLPKGCQCDCRITKRSG